jgi:hypothetical protein
VTAIGSMEQPCCGDRSCWPYQAMTAIYRAENADMALVRLEVEAERGKHREGTAAVGLLRPAWRAFSKRRDLPPPSNRVWPLPIS